MKNIGIFRWKILSYIFILLIISSCAEKKSSKIGFLIDSFETARWQKDKAYFEERVRLLGGEVISLSAQGDEQLQIKQAEELIDQGVGVLVIVATNTNTAAAIVRKAHSKGIKVIAYARLILACDLDYYISFNVEKIGELQANYVLTKKPTGNFVLINGDKSDINAVKEYTGVERVLRPYIEEKKINLLFTCFIDGWSPKDAAFYSSKILSLSEKNIDAFIVANDGMAESVVDVLNKNNILNKPVITGLDAEASACARILQGDQTMTVYMSIKDIANTAAELAMKIVNKQKIDFKLVEVYNGRKNVPSIILDPVVVDKDNIQSTVIAENYQSMEDIEKHMK